MKRKKEEDPRFVPRYVSSQKSLKNTKKTLKITSELINI